MEIRNAFHNADRMESPASEGHALVTFHRSTGGATWARTWDVNGDAAQDVGGATLGRPPAHAAWHGVGVVADDAGEHWVFSLRLRDIGLRGEEHAAAVGFLRTVGYCGTLRTACHRV